MGNKQYSENSNAILVLIGSIFLVIAVILMVVFFTQGETIITGENGSINTVQSMTCEKDQFDYPIFNFDGATNGTIKINVILNDDKASAVSLVYNLHRDDERSVKQSITNMRIAMNKSFAEDGLDTGAFNAAYASLPNSAQMSLYAKTEDLNADAAKYFLLERADSSFREAVITKIYSDKGLNCITTK